MQLKSFTAPYRSKN